MVWPNHFIILPYNRVCKLNLKVAQVAPEQCQPMVSALAAAAAPRYAQSSQTNVKKGSIAVKGSAKLYSLDDQEQCPKLICFLSAAVPKVALGYKATTNST